MVYRLALQASKGSTPGTQSKRSWKIVYEGAAEEFTVPGLTAGEPHTFQLQVSDCHPHCRLLMFCDRNREMPCTLLGVSSGLIAGSMFTAAASNCECSTCT